MGLTSSTIRPLATIADDALNTARASKESLQQLESLLHTLMVASTGHPHQHRTLQLGSQVAFEAWAYADEQLRVLDAELDAHGLTVGGDV
jgi:hypothetical protein